jgi:curved DNA-binding protein CbpA
MTSPHDVLGVAPDATLAQVKAAYHAKLREFPAHKYPGEFKAVRSAYEAIQKGGNRPQENFFTVRPIAVTIEPAAIDQLKEKLTAHLAVSLEDMLRETF